MGKQHQSHMPEKKKLKNDLDLCPICKKSLYLDESYSQRVGLLDEEDYCIGWMCPYCESTFDKDSKLTGIYGDDIGGEA